MKSKSWKIGSLVKVIFCRLNLETVLSEKSRHQAALSSLPQVLGGPGFHSELGTIFFLGEVVKFVQGQGGRESFGQLHSAFVARAAGTLVKIKLESQL